MKANQSLVSVGNERNQIVYGWLRWLVLLAAGSFAAMLALLGTGKFVDTSRLLLKAILLCQAGGILFGTIALYGEVVVIRRLLFVTVHHYLGIHNSKLEKYGASNGGMNVVPLPPIYTVCERLCYLFLLMAFGCMVALVWQF